MRSTCVALVAAAVVGAVAIAQQPAVPTVLKVVKREAGPNGTVVLTLTSGAQVIVPGSDIDEGATTKVQQLLGPQQKTASAAAVQDGTADDLAGIDRLCATRWPSDVTKRTACVDAQHAALQALNDRLVISDDARNIRSSCRREWPGDFVMIDTCERARRAGAQPSTSGATTTGTPTAPATTPRASTTPARVRCAATTQKGQQCSRYAEPGSAFCWQHKK